MGTTQVKSHINRPIGWKTYVWPCVLGKSAKASVNLWGVIHGSSHCQFRSCSYNAIFVLIDLSVERELHST